MRPIGTHGKAERNRGGASASPLHIVAARVSKRKMQRRAEKKKVAARPTFVRVPSGSTCRGAHSPRRVPAPTWGRAGRASASVKRYPPAPQFRPGPRGKAARPAAAPRGGVLVSSGAARGLALSGPAGSAPRGRLRARPACPRRGSVPLSVAGAPPAGLAPRKRVAGVAKRRLRARRPRGAALGAAPWGPGLSCRLLVPPFCAVASAARPPALCVVASVLPLAALKLKRLRGRAEARPFVRSPKKKR